MGRRLTLIAGSGALPALVLAAAREHGDEVQVLAIGAQSQSTIPGAIVSDVGNPAAILEAIRAFGSTHVTMAGGVHLSDAARDGIANALGGGSAPIGDAALSSLGVAIAKLTGAEVVGPQEIAATLLATRGRIGGPMPTAEQNQAAAFALRKATEFGSLDLGQALVATGRRVLAAEDVTGTDSLLARVKGYAFAGIGSELVLAKASKPGQPNYVDLPAIGATTVVNADDAGIAIIVVEAGKTLVLERAQLIAEADARGIPVIAMDVSDG